jgi:hypothetical protein
MDILGLGSFPLSCGNVRFKAPGISAQGARQADVPPLRLAGDNEEFIPRIVQARLTPRSSLNSKPPTRGLNSPRITSPRGGAKTNHGSLLSPRSSIGEQTATISQTTGQVRKSQMAEESHSGGGAEDVPSKSVGAAACVSRIEEITALLSRLKQGDEQGLVKASPHRNRQRRFGDELVSAPGYPTHPDDSVGDWKMQMVREQGNVISRRLWGANEGALQRLKSALIQP